MSAEFPDHPTDVPGDATFTALSDQSTEPPTFPAGPSDRYYDRRVWVLGEEGDEHVLVEGCDRRSYAALNAHCRAGGFPIDQVTARWVAEFETSCGCTPEQHGRHVNCWDDCGGNPELAPCGGDRFSWHVRWSDTPGSPAMPVLVGDREGVTEPLPPRVYPLTPDPVDDRFTMGLQLDVAAVFAAHGYPVLGPLDIIDLGQALYRWLHVGPVR